MLSVDSKKITAGTCIVYYDNKIAGWNDGKLFIKDGLSLRWTS